MVDISVTAANVQPVTTGTNRTKIASVTAGATITAGQAVYKNSSGTWAPADADASAETAGQRGVGVALNGASSGQPLDVAIGGEYDPGATATEGVIYVLSGTAGGIAPSADLAANDWVTILGVGNSSGNIDLICKYFYGSQVQ